jgi:hypothetical protein
MLLYRWCCPHRYAPPETQDERTAIENQWARNDKGSLIMKIRRAEFLLAVAIVTSAAVMQVREYVLKTAPQGAVQTMSCGATHQGLAPAACATVRGERSVDGAARPQQAALRIWV